MTIKEILANGETSAQTKLKEISEVVKTIKEIYGNSNVELKVPEAVTVDGCKPITLLTAEDKVALVTKEFNTIVTNAYEDTQLAEGLVLDRRIEEYVAINPILSNIQTSNNSKYL